jgi:hypothetical protein
MVSQLSTPGALSVPQISTQEIRTALSSTGHLFSLNKDTNIAITTQEI